jgi:hypothetical protein
LRDAVLVSSTGDARDKASLDALLARMAEKLAPRFASTASHDAADTADRNGADPSGAPSDGGGTAEQVHATTLETMLRAGGKRSARVRRVTRVTAA